MGSVFVAAEPVLRKKHMLDSRLQTAFDMYPECDVAADIGCDHGLLPCALVRSGKCGRMILSDVSSKALAHAAEQVRKDNLAEKCTLICADGLDGIEEKCGCISIMGMGGETISHILRKGERKLSGASLILSPQTDLPLVRRAVHDIGCHISEERVCFTVGRYYLIFLAEAGTESVSDEEIRHGRRKTSGNMEVLHGYLTRQIAVLEKQMSGLIKAENCDRELLEKVQADIAWYTGQLENEVKTC